MRLLGYLLFLLLLAYGAWPYYHVYSLDRALGADDRAELAQLIDMEAVRAARKRQLEHSLDRTVGAVPSNPMTQMIRQGAAALGGSAVDANVDLDWVRITLAGHNYDPRAPYPSLLERVSFAFFEAPAKFLVRLGPLDENPIHLEMNLQGWQWRVTAIYD